MLTGLMRLFGVTKAKTRDDRFEPVFGLPKDALEEWLSRNPEFKKKYRMMLSRRLRRLPRDD